VPELLVIFDCVVFLQGLIKASGPAVTCLKHFEEGRFELAVSPETLAELRDVLTRSSLRKSLMEWDTEEGRHFRNRFPQLKILDPVSFLKELEPIEDR
jgi:predicted nucleic acid-binding protein